MNVIKEFWAKAGSVTMPDGVTMPFWGFASAQDEMPKLPGPTIEAKVGDNVRITFHNTLAEPVSIIFPGQDIVPEPVKDENNTFVSFTRHAPPYGGTVTYSFKAARPGTYLYESGSSPEKQVQMGLYGMLIIRPADYNPAVGNRTAYGRGSGTEYDVERIIVTGELDSALHGKIAAGLPYNMLYFAPDYFTINGRAYPDTINPDNGSSQPYGAAVKAASGKRVLLRCANAGFLTHSLHLSGGYFRVVAGDGTPLKTALDTTYQKTTITIGSGQTYDLILVADIPGEIYLYDRELRCTVNADQFPGGIMTLIKVVSGPPGTPGNLAASAVSSSKVILSWTDNSGGESGFWIERMKGSTGSFTQIADVSAGITSYEDTAVEENTTYSYRISAYNEYGSSGYSNTAIVTTPASPPQAPSNLVANRISYFQIQLTWTVAWTDYSKTETVFKIERRSRNEPNYTEIGITLPYVNIYFDSLKNTGTTYYYRVRAQNSGGSSPYSNIASVK